MTYLLKTKTLPSSIQIPKFVISIGKTLQFISLKLASWFAIKLFITPISYPTPKREKAMGKSAQKKKLIVASINKEIHVLSYGYSKKKVLLAHGWAGRSTQLFMFADKLLEKGYMVISFDAPAHGKSSGKTTNLIEYMSTIKALNEEFGPFEAAIGHSFGAMALLNVSTKNNLFKSLVCIGAADYVSGILNRFVKSLELKPKLAKVMYESFRKKWRVNINDYSANISANKVGIPTFIIHDSKDGDVPVSCAYEIRQNLKKGSLLITEGLGHTKILRDKKIVNRAVNFILSKS